MPKASKKKAVKKLIETKSAVETTESEEDKRPPYPEQSHCGCTRESATIEPEWEWQFDNTWSCLGCGETIEVDPEEKKPAPKAKQVVRKYKKGDKITFKFHLIGLVTEYESTVTKVCRNGVIEIDDENDEDKPYRIDTKTGKFLNDCTYMGAKRTLKMD